MLSDAWSTTVPGGREFPEDLYLIACDSRCMTDWDITNLVGGQTLYRPDRPAPIGQTGLSRDWSNFVLRAKNIALKRKRTNLSRCR